MGGVTHPTASICRWISAKCRSHQLAEFKWRFSGRFHLEAFLERLLGATNSLRARLNTFALVEVGRQAGIFLHQGPAKPMTGSVRHCAL